MPKCSALPQILALLGGVAFAACQWLVFAYAPEEATLGLAQKIFYIHLPMSDCVRYPAPGCVVEYMEGNAVQIALVTEEVGGRLRLLLPNRRETRLNSSRLLPWIGPMVGAGFAAILLLVGITLLALEKIIVKPLQELESYARSVASGELDRSLTLVRRNEIGHLADSLRSMRSAQALSQATVTGILSLCSSQAVRRAPWRKGRVSSAITLMRLPCSTAPRITPSAVP